MSSWYGENIGKETAYKHANKTENWMLTEYHDRVVWYHNILNGVAKRKKFEGIYEDHEISGVDRMPSPLGRFIIRHSKKNNEQFITYRRRIQN